MLPLKSESATVKLLELASLFFEIASLFDCSTTSALVMSGFHISSSFSADTSGSGVEIKSSGVSMKSSSVGTGQLVVLLRRKSFSVKISLLSFTVHCSSCSLLYKRVRGIVSISFPVIFSDNYRSAVT